MYVNLTRSCKICCELFLINIWIRYLKYHDILFISFQVAEHIGPISSTIYGKVGRQKLFMNLCETTKLLSMN